MLKDIKELSSVGVSLAAVRDLNDEKELVWNIYLINHKEVPIEGVLVMSKGSGEIDGEERQTSTLRHFLDTVQAQSYTKVEPLPEDLIGFTNKYFLTYYADNVLCEKNFEFAPWSISEKKAEHIEMLGRNGVELVD